MGTGAQVAATLRLDHPVQVRAVERGMSAICDRVVPSCRSSTVWSPKPKGGGPGGKMPRGGCSGIR